MARFIRDEKKTYPLTWLTIGGLFAASSVWAVYAEFVTRVPWEEHQQAFFEMDNEQAKQGLDRAKNEWEKEIEPALKARLDRRAELEESKKSGAYKTARDRLDQLNVDFANAEEGKTFGGSDLDEAYYYRNLAEYERDAASTAVRRLYRDAMDPAKANAITDAMYADPPAPPRGEESLAVHHLEAEIARMTAHLTNIDKALSDVPEGVRAALLHSREAEAHVVERLKVEIKHQKRVDTALAAMNAIDGPPEPRVSAKSPAEHEAEQKKLRGEACVGKEDTRNCIQWLTLEPVDAELKLIEVEVAKSRRTLTDAELRAEKSESRANPKFNPENLIQSLVGPYQITQVVTSWIDFEREVDIEQVDRCQTCHMGIDSGAYQSAEIPAEFRTHPNRSTLFAAHPIENFGCTSCHQGQGRATDDLAHSGWHLEEKHGKERWHFAGDHYWDDPLLPVGELTRILIDDRNDGLEVKINKNKWASVPIEHRTGRAVEGDERAAEYKDEAELFGAIQGELAKLVDAEADLKGKWHAVVRKVDNRVEIGVVADDPSAHVSEKEMPSIGVRFTKPEAATLFGFAEMEASEKQPIQRGTLPPSVPIRGDAMPEVAADGRYHPPSGAVGLQVPDEMRNRFIESIPEIESGCLRCHNQDVDLSPRRSSAAFINAKLDYEKAEALLAKDPEAYKAGHNGSAELPPVPADPADAENPVPTLAEGRALFRDLNCTGCHILDNFPWDKNAGPGLDNLTAKVDPQWILTWIRNPRGWRAKTRMPNLWPEPLDPASKRPYAETAPEYANWEKTMREETVAVAAYLVERSDNPATRPGAAGGAQATPLRDTVAGYADVPGATAEQGKVFFESYGCQGCHAASESDTAEAKLPDAWRNRERDAAPTLANLGGKTTADWIAYWVEDPARYWHGTKMPNLRLSRLEAASVAKYIASLKTEPLNAAHVESDDVALVTDSAKRNEKVACASAGGAMLTRVECGEKLIGFYGCFGCHNISGFEKNAPIAPELGGFAKKDVSTLDFGYAIADHHLQTTETFATLKLDSPRIYRRDRIELKMGDFDLSPREIRSLVLFLKGLVPSKPRPTFDPTSNEAYAATLEGRQLVDDLNCRGCHLIEGRGADIDGFRQAQLSADGQARAPFLTGEGARVQPEWLFGFMREPGKNGIRPWLHPEWAYGDSVPDDKRALRMPTFNLSSEQVTAIVRYFSTWDGQDYPYQAPKVKELAEQEKLYALSHMLSTEAANCLSCHFQGEFPVERGQSELAKMAPNMNLIQKRLRPEWVRSWLLRPANYMPYTKMTGFWATADRPKGGLWAGEQDPFISKAPEWKLVPGFEDYTGEQQAEVVRDFLFGLPPNAVFPKPGEELSSPLVRPQPIAAPDGKGKDKGKRTGALPVPARM